MAQGLITLGFSKVFALKGGYNEWIRSKFPIEEKPAAKSACASCHLEITPNIVSDWKESKHSRHDVSCSVCHGIQHTSEHDVDRVVPLAPYTCAGCHSKQGEQFKAGKYALAWDAVKVWPGAHWPAMERIEGTTGCRNCHKVGIKSKAEIGALKRETENFGIMSCDVCHTQHVFSIKDARRPQACRACHAGADSPQWETYSKSKHGFRYLHPLEQDDVPPRKALAPTCQDCHMENGNHEVRTAWGFMAVRLPLPDDDKTWGASSKTILQALGMLDDDGKGTSRLEVVNTQDIFRLSQEDWQRRRRKMLETCSRCHSSGFAQRQLEKGDQMVRQADLLMAEAISLAAGLYGDMIIERPVDDEHTYPDLLGLYDASTPLERRLFSMFFRSRSTAIHGMFHASPDHAYIFGLESLRLDLIEIKDIAERLRRKGTESSK